jgi:hypothetical protein
MRHTWASGAIELLRHADSHIDLDSAFDRRIAFISIDNSVETSIRTFLSLPTSKSGINVSRKDVDLVENNFPGLLGLLWRHAAHRLTGIDEADIEHYHRIRNKLYHDGTGLSVDVQYLQAYRQIAALLLQNLFGILLPERESSPTLDRLIALWNQIQKAIASKLERAGIEHKHASHSQFWLMAMESGLLTADDVEKLKSLRVLRNQVVHSSEIDVNLVAETIRLAEHILAKLTESA